MVIIGNLCSFRVKLVLIWIIIVLFLAYLQKNKCHFLEQLLQ